MHATSWTKPLLLLLLASCLTGTGTALSLATDWKEDVVLEGNPFAGITLTANGSRVFAGGSQLLVRDWDDSARWGGHAGFVAAMSSDGRYVVTSSASRASFLNSSGFELWSLNLMGQVRAVAVSPEGAFLITADDQGTIESWTKNGIPLGRNRTSLVKHIAIAPTSDLVVATTTAGTRYYTKALEPVWSDPRDGELDDLIVISEDGSTIITAGGTRVSSHTRNGVRNWQADVTGAAINDIACNRDCSLVVVGSQDNKVRTVDRNGKVRWSYDTGQWANAVGTSANGNLIAAGSNDGTVVILDKNGRLQAKKSFPTRIQPRTLAMSRDGSRIATADQNFLYGLALIGTPVAEQAASTYSDTIYITGTETPVPRTTATVTVPGTEPPAEVTPPEETRPVATATTKQSPVAVGGMVTAAGCAILLAHRAGRTNKP